MAFEDRCSPNQANSPGPMTNGSPTNPSNSPSPNPNERALKPYTCSTITSKYDRTKSPSDKMLSSNMTYVKTQGIVTLPVNSASNEIDGSLFLSNRNHQNVMYNPYLNPYVIYNGNSPLRSFVGTAYDPRPALVQQHDLSPPHHMVHHPQQINGNETEDQNTNLQFSISNILRPEFGLNAIRKSTNKIEGPKAGGPVQSILYKPYELAKPSPDVRNLHIKTQNDYTNGRTLSTKKSMEIRNARLPLGGLHHAISQIGVVKPIPSKVSSNGFSDPGRIVSNHSQIERPKTFASFHASTTGAEDSCRPGSANSSISTASSSIAAGSDDGASSKAGDSSNGDASKGQQWPAWVYCTRYSDRPSSGPRSRRSKKKPTVPSVATPSASSSVNSVNASSASSLEDKRPRTAFSGSQLARLKHEFAENRYLTERRRQQLSSELGLNEAQIKIWFQNKRAKIKKATGQKNPLALQLMAQGLYNHGTASCSEGEDEDIEVGSVAGN